MTDSSAVLVEGPWRHRFVAANGARFHVVTAEPGLPDVGNGAPTPDRARGGTTAAPLVMLLHGFPQVWWAWRHQLPALALAGYRVAALDLRGAGASDKPPHGYDMPTLARDVAGVIRSLGERRAVVVGHGVGGTIAWSMPSLQPAVTAAVAAVGAPHPLRTHSLAGALRMLNRAGRRLAYAQLPYLPERSMTHGDLVVRLLTEWGAPGWPPPDVARFYRAAAQIPFAAHSGLETLRWLLRSTPRVDGQRYLAAVRDPVRLPVLQVHGTRDRCIPLGAAREDNGSPYRFEVVPGVGHFVPEEAPERFTALLLDWLATLPSR